MAKVRTQADRRQWATATDRHGRKWATIIEKDTMHPCSTPRPKGWTPPKLYGKKAFLPPEQYISYAADDPFDMIIDYDSWIADVEAEHRRYDDAISSAATMQFGSRASAAIREQNAELLRYVGPRPMPTEPIKAAKKGNLYVLGLSQNMPTWAIPFFTAPAVVEEEFPNADADFPDAPEPTVGEREGVSPFDDSGEDFPNVEEPADTAQVIVDADEDFEQAISLEEEHDPKATGGTSVNPRAAARDARVPKEKPQPKPRPKART